MKIAQNGPYGVDIFFVLSGFLIGFILFKEIEKYGPSIDKFNFYRSRFIRLYPVLVFWWLTQGLLFDAMAEQKYPGTLSIKSFTPLLFVNNYITS